MARMKNNLWSSQKGIRSGRHKQLTAFETHTAFFRPSTYKKTEKSTFQIADVSMDHAREHEFESEAWPWSQAGSSKQTEGHRIVVH